MTKELSQKQRRTVPESEDRSEKKDDDGKKTEKRKREETEEEEDDSEDEDSEYFLGSDREWRNFVEGRFISLDQLLERRFKKVYEGLASLSKKVDEMNGRKKRRWEEVEEAEEVGENGENGEVNGGNKGDGDVVME